MGQVRTSLTDRTRHGLLGLGWANRMRIRVFLGKGDEMLRWISCAAIAASMWGGPALSQSILTYGVFRENLPNSPVNQRNCWSQAMVSGLTINGEVVASGLTQAQAAQQLTQLGNTGLCANQRTATDWAARHEGSGGAGGNGGAGAGLPDSRDRDPREHEREHRERIRRESREGSGSDRVDADRVDSHRSNRDFR